MKIHHRIFRRLRNVAALVVLLLFVFSILLPPVLGMLTRQVVLTNIDRWQGVLTEFDISALHADVIRSDWFSSQIRISASGPVLSADGKSTATRNGLLHINHGPLIWHLADSLLAAAELHLTPLSQGTDINGHFSASAIAAFRSPLTLEVTGVAGVQAAGGEHWFELQSTLPLLPFSDNARWQLWLDLDKRALHAAGLSESLATWEQSGNARISNNRLMFSTGAQ